MQNKWLTEEEATSSTAAVKALMIVCAINASEHRDVVTCDIKGSYLQALMDEIIHMKIEEPMIDFLCAACPQYRNYI